MKVFRLSSPTSSCRKHLHPRSSQLFATTSSSKDKGGASGRIPSSRGSSSKARRKSAPFQEETKLSTSTPSPEQPEHTRDRSLTVNADSLRTSLLIVRFRRMEAAKEAFFKADHYAVVGASKDPAKIGNKVLKWYKEHDLEAIPVHPKEAAIENIATIASVFDIHEPASTSVSVITPPHVTMPIIKTALLELGVAGIWLQPGAEDDDIKAWVEAAPDEIKNKVILGGPCILVEGEKLAKAEGKL